MDSLTLERHNSFQIWNNRKATNAFAPKSCYVATNFKVQYLRQLGLPKNWPGGEYFKFRIFDSSLLNNLSIYLTELKNIH